MDIYQKLLATRAKQQMIDEQVRKIVREEVSNLMINVEAQINGQAVETDLKQAIIDQIKKAL